ncbi:MAG: dihydroorotate dehydrogenase [Christensenellales bacterium]
MNLQVNIAGVDFRNPVIASSGTFGFGSDYLAYFPVSALGGISLKTLTLQPRKGNAPPRIAETPSGMLNSIGLQNPGIEAFLEQELGAVQQLDTTVIANIAGEREDEYCKLAEMFSGVSGIALLEVNVSCPNVKKGCLSFGSTPEGVYEITKSVKSHTKKPVIIKLTPMTADIAATARAAEEGGADAVSLMNTLTGMVVDVAARKPVLANGTGGLSGPAIRPVALNMVYKASHAVSIPVIGGGGIMTGEDAVAFLLCGARAVTVGTAGFTDPFAWVRIVEELKAYMEQHAIGDINQLVGGLLF